ncbi:MAG TPA: helix-turn-helix transcriptional regulator [Roseiarcus sp.]|nr:helix-turn-helix transcriptional regulator [Roseiarcus sp.]
MLGILLRGRVRALRKQHRHLHARPNGAACAGYSSAHFSRAFRETFQVTPHAFVLDRRIERASELLARPDHSLLDVAQLTGFQTQQHFSRVFRQRIGISPGAFRHAG